MTREFSTALDALQHKEESASQSNVVPLPVRDETAPALPQVNDLLGDEDGTETDEVPPSSD